ncbi:MAG: PAS domain S-box protein [Spirochaetales bacterium]|nr:PAS domain S-box protein [Spirochaetales bacterium]
MKKSVKMKFTSRFYLPGKNKERKRWKFRGSAAKTARDDATWYRLLFETCLDAVLLTSPEGRIFRANRTACAVLGYSEAELRRAGRAGIADASDPKWIAALDERMRGGRFHGELVFIRKDGTKFTADVSSVCFFDRRRRTRYSLVIRDMTERKRSEERMADAFRYNRTVIDSSPVGIVTCTASGNVVSVNPAFRRMTGEDIGAIFPQNAFRLRLWRESGMLAAAEKALASGRECRHEARTVSPRGEESVFDCMFVPFQYREKRRLLVIMADISERKRAEKELETMHDRFRLLTQATFEGVCIHEGGVALNINEQFHSLFGYKPDELLGKQVIPLVIAPESRETVERRVAEGVRGSYEAVGVRKDGTFFPIEIRARSMNFDGHSVRAAAVLDISERKSAELEIRKSHEDLRRLADHLNHVREEERKHLAREFHDRLGQSMAALKMDLSLLSRENAAGKRGMPRKRLTGELKAAGDLVDEMARVLREIISGLRPQMIDEMGLAAALAWEAERFEIRSGVVCRLVTNAANIPLDPSCSIALFRVCQEALTNVFRHAGASAVTVELNAVPGFLLLDISDNGRGLADEAKTKPKTFGLLGMRERALALGGSLAVTSFPGKGTTVTVRLPLPGAGPEKEAE